MAESFQNEIPKARINITLDLETHGARKKKELPLKLLVLGDFSQGKTQGPVAERERININKNNLNTIMRDLAPELDLSVPNHLGDNATDMRVHLKLDSMQSLHPEAITHQVPALQNLLAMRNLLKDLKSNLLDNKAFRRALEKIVQTRPELEALQRVLQHAAPLNRDT